MERKYGSGNEHHVSPHPTREGFVRKEPRFLQRLTTSFDEVHAETERVKLIAPTIGLRVAETEIYPIESRFGILSGYEVIQEVIGDDGTCGDIAERLEELKFTNYLPEYSTRPANFGCQDNTVIIFDTTKGLIPRFIEKTGIISATNVRKINRGIKSLIANFRS